MKGGRTHRHTVCFKGGGLVISITFHGVRERKGGKGEIFTKGKETKIQILFEETKILIGHSLDYFSSTKHIVLTSELVLVHKAQWEVFAVSLGDIQDS